jgi:selenide, water dikinase
MTSAGPIPLTSLSHGAGCGCKLSAADIGPIVAGLATSADPRLLVGASTADDAGVVQVREDLALVQTVDFFTPIVDDPYDFGRIAATNALSDVYAMGAEPLSALNLVAFPLERLGPDVLAEILRGGSDVLEQAGALLVGGHSIDDPEPKYGMAVTGVVDLDRIIRNDAAVAGTALSLTKPLGVGVLNSRMKATGEVSEEAVASMTALNAGSGRAAVAAGIRAGTDVTGFGLLGHLYKMARASGVTAVVDAAAVPYLTGAREALADGFVSGGTRRNLDWVRPHTDLSAVSEDEALLLADAQTSGGLLLGGEVPGASVIGEFVPRGEFAVIIR